VNDHHMVEEGDQQAAIEAFLVAHKGHTQDVELPRSTWSIYCRCNRCGDIHTYEVDNQSRQHALRLAPWQEPGEAAAGKGGRGMRRNTTRLRPG
jgi:hypothetical protein